MSILKYLELFKLRIGMLLALTAIAGYFSVVETFQFYTFFILLVSIFFCSSGSSVFNHYYDRDIDRKMSRTRERPLAAGDMKNPINALWIAFSFLLIGIFISFYALNFVVTIHLVLGAFIYMFVYTVWLKRRHWSNIVIGGASGSFPLLAGAAAANPEIFFLPMLMGITLFFWTPSHFWALAILIKDDYKKAGVPMLPVVVGDHKCAKFMMINTFLLLFSSIVPYFFGLLGIIYLIIALTFGFYFLWLNYKLLKNQNHIFGFDGRKVKRYVICEA